MIFLKLLSKLIKLLRSGAEPRQIAGGFILGMMLGLISFRTSFAVPIVLCIIVLNVNLASSILGWLVFRGLAYLIDPAIHSFGFWILVRAEVLQGFWTTLYSLPWVPYTRFNNTLVMGSLILSLILCFPIYWGVKWLIIGYRERFEEKIQQWRILKILRGSKLFRWFVKVRDLGVQ